jgi:class 3 adenylate cyclase
MPSETHPPGHIPSQRTLAAIVFTDVVSFSARMHTDEVATLKLLQRDFGEMRRICEEHEGAVLKTTGDGLLLTFTSAVQAVACALAMQRQFAAEAKDSPHGGALQHRIGIHLGDVLVQDKDVMGDGVNIAARLQSEAEPGGICISQTVYDVVKNKLEMQAVSLGARDLKNIAEAMPVYRLLLEAQSLNAAGKPVAGPVVEDRSPFRRLGIAAAGLTAVLAIAAFVYIRRVSKPADAASPAVPPAAVAPVAAPLSPPTAVPKAAVTDIAGDLSDEFGKRADTMHKIHELYLDKYDFSGLVLSLRDKAEDSSASPALKQLLRSAEQLVRLKSWLETTLRHHGKLHPLAVADLSGDPAAGTSVYLSPDQHIVVMEAGNPVSMNWPDVKAPMFGAIVVGAVQEAKETRRVPLEAAMTFARLYSLPQMTKALERIRNKGGETAAK